MAPRLEALGRRRIRSGPVPEHSRAGRCLGVRILSLALWLRGH
jgi:hypothetical protein